MPGCIARRGDSLLPMTPATRPAAVDPVVRALPLAVLLAVAPALAQEPYQPQIGQPGKDVVWVPTPELLVQRMLAMAQVGPGDVVFDLGSGDGRMVIAAAKRGARAVGIEYDPDMVRLARKNAAEAGVAEKAIFVQGDMFEADFKQATVLALFLLPGNLRRLAPKAPESRCESGEGQTTTIGTIGL